MARFLARLVIPGPVALPGVWGCMSVCRHLRPRLQIARAFDWRSTSPARPPLRPPWLAAPEVPDSCRSVRNSPDPHHQGRIASRLSWRKSRYRTSRSLYMPVRLPAMHPVLYPTPYIHTISSKAARVSSAQPKPSLHVATRTRTRTRQRPTSLTPPPPPPSPPALQAPSPSSQFPTSPSPSQYYPH